MAVLLLVAIAGVLAWGTIYETRFGTAAVQRFIYHAWWFQAALAFLVLNLTIAALLRYPWKIRQAPFLLAHLGIILVLLGGILGAQFGVEGQLLIPEGQAERTLQLPGNVLLFHQANPGLHASVPTQFETQAWVHEPHWTTEALLGGRRLQVSVDHYFPNAAVTEEVTADGIEENPAAQLVVSHEAREETFWLFARDPERFGTRWQEGHFLFLEPKTEAQFTQLIAQPPANPPVRGVVTIEFPKLRMTREVPVPDELGRPVAVPGTPYLVTFKEYFTDLAITEQGIVNQSDAPNNPAVAFTLSGPEGADAWLVFALHPEFADIHAQQRVISAHATYRHGAKSLLPPQTLALVRRPGAEALTCVMTDTTMQAIAPCQVGARYTHPWLHDDFIVRAFYPRAKVTRRFENRDNEVRAEALHLIVREADASVEAWVGLREAVPLALGKEPIIVEYRPAQQELPFTIKLLDFRKIDYPGTQMAAAFESDVELSDPGRGIILMRTIRMNKPLKYRGFSFYQSSYIPGATETTVLAARSDPGTPFVYAGFVVIILGVISLFWLRDAWTDLEPHARRPRAPTRSSV